MYRHTNMGEACLLDGQNVCEVDRWAIRGATLRTTLKYDFNDKYIIIIYTVHINIDEFIENIQCYTCSSCNYSKLNTKSMIGQKDHNE